MTNGHFDFHISDSYVLGGAAKVESVGEVRFDHSVGTVVGKSQHAKNTCIVWSVMSTIGIFQGVN
jgi:hypothetical protein